MLKLRIQSFSKEILLSYSRFISLVFNKFEVQHNIVFLPVKITRITLIKSPHVYKKFKEHFERRSYKILVTFNEGLSNSHIHYLILNKPKSLLLSFSKN